MRISCRKSPPRKGAELGQGESRPSPFPTAPTFLLCWIPSCCIQAACKSIQSTSVPTAPPAVACCCLPQSPLEWTVYRQVSLGPHPSFIPPASSTRPTLTTPLELLSVLPFLPVSNTYPTSSGEGLSTLRHRRWGPAVEAGRFQKHRPFVNPACLC